MCVHAHTDIHIKKSVKNTENSKYKAKTLKQAMKAKGKSVRMRGGCYRKTDEGKKEMKSKEPIVGLGINY